MISRIISRAYLHSTSLNEYFPCLEIKDHYWVQNPFRVTEKPSDFHAAAYEKLIEMTSDTEVKTKFEKLFLDVFWDYINKEYPDISKQAIKILLPFSTTYLYDSGFSRYTSTKTKYRSKLDTAEEVTGTFPPGSFPLMRNMPLTRTCSD